MSATQDALKKSAHENVLVRANEDELQQLKALITMREEAKKNIEAITLKHEAELRKAVEPWRKMRSRAVYGITIIEATAALRTMNQEEKL